MMTPSSKFHFNINRLTRHSVLKSHSFANIEKSAKMDKLSVFLMLLCFYNNHRISYAIPINIQAGISLKIDGDHLELSKTNANIWLRLGLVLSSGDPGTRATVTDVSLPTVALPITVTPAPPTVATTAAPVALPIMATTTTTTALPTTACPYEFSRVGDHCYHFSSTKTTFNDASIACHSLGAALAHPKNSHENSLLTDYLRDNKSHIDHWWIGATDRDNEGQCVWAHDRSPLSYTDWSEGEPSDAYENEDCVEYRVYNNYKWNDVPCNNKFQYICQQGDSNDIIQGQPSAQIKSEGVTTTAATLTVSKSDFVQLGEHSYYFSTTTASFEDATKACQSIDTTLAHPKNAKDNSLITEYIQNNKPSAKSWWIGATDRDKEGQWVWVHDGILVGYSDWLSGEPNDAFENEDCAQLRREATYDWNDAPCGNKYNYICQYENLNVDSQDEFGGEVEASGDDVDTPTTKWYPNPIQLSKGQYDFYVF